MSRAQNSSTNIQCSLLVQMWDQMVKDYKDDLPSNFHEGLLKVLEGKFAFVATSSGVRFEIEHGFSTKDSCRIHEMEGDYVSSNLAFGLRKKNPYKQVINSM